MSLWKRRIMSAYKQPRQLPPEMQQTLIDHGPLELWRRYPLDFLTREQYEHMKLIERRKACKEFYASLHRTINGK